MRWVQASRPLDRSGVASRGGLCHILGVAIRVLALDIGTSSVRASLYGEDGAPVPGGAARVPHQVAYHHDGGVETDPDALLCRVDQAVAECLRASPGPVAAVGASCFWHSLMGVDGQMRPRTPLLIWADTRSAPDIPVLARRLDAEAVRARTGCRLHSSYPPAKLAWIRRARPDWWLDVRYWLSFGEYVTWHLTGELVASVSLASGSGLYDQRAGDWDAEVLEAVGISAAQLPPVADLAEPGPLPPRRGGAWGAPDLVGARLLLPAGDGACNNVGSGCMGPDRMALMIGTSGAARLCRIGGPWTLPPALWQYRLDRRRGLVGGALSNGGNLHQWLHETLRLSEHGVDAAVAAMPPGGHGLVFLPLLAGERSPGWSAGAFGAVVGLREATTPLHMLRAGMEAVAMRFAAIVTALGGDPVVVGSGGGIWHSPAWTQIVADALGRDVHRSAEREASSRGAALLCLEALGVLRDAGDVPPPISGVTTAEPGRRDVYQRLWALQQRLYDLLRADPALGFGEG